MYYYKAKRMFDSNGDLIGYERIRPISTRNAHLEFGWEILASDVGTRSPKPIKDTEGRWAIIEDAAAKAVVDQTKQNHNALKIQRAGLKPSDIDTVVKMRPLFLKMAHALERLL